MKAKRVLVISYYWPPAGGISVLRSLKIVKYLRDFGWEPVVFTASNAHYPYLDEGGLADVPKNLEILKLPIIEPFKLFKWLTGRKKTDPLNSIVQIKDDKSSWFDLIGIYLRGNFFIPDARALWIQPSVKYLKNYLSTHPVDAIFSDGPPHTNTVIAYQLKKELGIPWLMDFQDPWTQADYYQMMPIGRRASIQHRTMEQECLHAANKTTIASNTWKKDLESIGATNVEVLYYGYDEDDFKQLQKNKPQDTFDIIHIGLIGHDRAPVDLMEVIEKIKSSKPIRLRLAGQIDQTVKKQLKQIAHHVQIDFLGIVSRKDALQLAMNAHLLILLLNQAENAQGRLPGKLYEYLRTYNPILALGPPASDAHKILKECNAGICCAYEDQKSQAAYINLMMRQDTSTVLTDNPTVLNYSNKSQTQKVAQYLEEIL